MYKGINKYKENDGTINIVIHHSAGEQNGNFNNILTSYNRQHKIKYFDEPEKKNKMGQEIGKEKDGNISKFPYLAYHYCINGNGEYSKNRNVEQVGYHCANWKHNNKSIAVCCFGNFENVKITKIQEEKLIWLLFEILKNYGDKNEKGIIVSKLSIKGHRDFSATACPGKNLYILLEKYNKEIENKRIEYNKEIENNKKEDNKENNDNYNQDIVIEATKIIQKYKNTPYKLAEIIVNGEKYNDLCK